MTFTSAFNAHPDEFHHARAADFYRTHWLPPKFGDPDAVPSYSDYGTSYLHERDIVYLLAGKWSIVIAPLVGSVETAYRLFNLMLFALLVLAFACNRYARPLLIPLILSAQIWYVFSYFNGDALALSAAFFVGYEIAVPGSGFSRALAGSPGWRRLAGVVVLGVGVGVVLLAKRNFYIFLVFLAAYVALKEFGFRAALGVALATLVGLAWYFQVPAGIPTWFYIGALLGIAAMVLRDVVPRLSDAACRQRASLYIAAGAVGLSLFLPRVAYDRIVVESPANAIASAQAAAEIYAEDALKRSHITEGTVARGFYLRERGISYGDALFGRKISRGRTFLWLSFRSAVGVYGWLDISSSDRFYVVVGAGYLSFLLALIYWGSHGRGRVALEAIALACVFALLTVLISSLHSWTTDFQAQGRYLFPISVMIGMVMSRLPGRQPAMATVVTGLLFGLAAYSFCDAGLRLIAKS
jgi:hypothetical protein